MTRPPPSREVNLPSVVIELTAAFLAYERALATNDVPALVRHFRDAGETVRFGPTEHLYGAAQIARFRSTRSVSDLARTLTRWTVTTYGEDVGVTAAEFVRTSSGRRGQQTQTWIRDTAGWCVVQAHVALLDPA